MTRLLPLLGLVVTASVIPSGDDAGDNPTPVVIAEAAADAGKHALPDLDAPPALPAQPACALAAAQSAAVAPPAWSVAAAPTTTSPLAVAPKTSPPARS